jgi:hypothetical protein
MHKALSRSDVSAEFYPGQTSSDVRKRFGVIVNRVSGLMTSLLRHANDKCPQDAKFECTLMEIRRLMDSHIVSYLSTTATLDARI